MLTDEEGRAVRLAAYVICVDAQRRLLLCRLAPGIDNSGRWTLPGGGIDFGEHPEEAALRELHEETGLRGRLTGLLHLDSEVGDWAGPASGGGELRPYHVVRFVYRAEIESGYLRDEVNGSSDKAAWHHLDELARVPLVPMAKRMAALARP